MQKYTYGADDLSMRVYMYATAPQISLENMYSLFYSNSISTLLHTSV